MECDFDYGHGWLFLAGANTGKRINPDFWDIEIGEKIQVHEIGKIYKHIEHNICLYSKTIGTAFGPIRQCQQRGNKYHVEQFKLSEDGKLSLFRQRDCLSDFSNCKSDVSRVDFSIKLKQ